MLLPAALIFVALVATGSTVAQQPAPVTWTATFLRPLGNETTLHMSDTVDAELLVQGLNRADLLAAGDWFRIRAANEFLLSVAKEFNASDVSLDGKWQGEFVLEAKFLGLTDVYVERMSSAGEVIERAAEVLPIIIIREVRTIDHVFAGSVATLVSLLYINFGAALSLSKVKSIAKRPVGPAIGFCGQFIVMPLVSVPWFDSQSLILTSTLSHIPSQLSFGFGMLLFPDNPEMQLGMFFTGVSPAGGASNIWTVLLGGNLDLSIAMTSFSNIASFGMMPLWLFTLGRVIFDRGNIEVPYQTLSTYLVALIVPLVIGLLIQRFMPRVTRILVRILKPLSSALIVFIVVFAIITNLYLFELFSWQIIVAGLGLPWLAYVLGYTLAWICQQPYPDRLAIALETGIQNTGIAIFLLRFTLPQPQADLTTVVPVSVAIMTPVPLLLMFIWQKVAVCVEHRRW